MAQLLAWIAATFRRPRREKTCRSNVFFGAQASNLTYGLHLGILADLEDGEHGTCWKPLFPSSIVANGFPVPTCPEATGLQISVTVMFELAEILSDVTLEDDDGNDTGVFFEGILWRLYPTKFFEARNTVQWHLAEVPSGELFNPALAPDHYSSPVWCRGVGREALENATAILGYCSRVNIKLGTESQISQHKKYLPARAETERPLPEASVSGATFSSGGRPAVSLATNLRYRKAHKVEQGKTKDYSYRQMLKLAAKEPVILFDTELGNERAWMVPQLSLILDLYNFWAGRHEDAEVRKQVRYAKLGPDGGENAKTALDDDKFSSKILIKSSYPGDPEQSAGAIVKKIWGRIRTRVQKDDSSDDGARGTWNIGRTPIPGWDWMELIDEFSGSMAHRRNARPHIGRAGKPSWLPLALTVPVVFVQNIGEALVPEHLDNVCKHWYPLPGGFNANYLAASVRCLESLSASSGDISKLCDQVIWKISLKDTCIFHPCNIECRQDSKKCVKHPQSLENARNRLRKSYSQSGNQPPFSAPSDGAVIFAHKRQREDILHSNSIEDINGLGLQDTGNAVDDAADKGTEENLALAEEIGIETEVEQHNAIGTQQNNAPENPRVSEFAMFITEWSPVLYDWWHSSGRTIFMSVLVTIVAMFLLGIA